MKRRNRVSSACALWVLLLWPQPIAAQDNQDAVGFGDGPAHDQDAVGFGGDAHVSSSAPAPAMDESTPSPWRARVTLLALGAVRTETDVPSRFAKLRNVLDGSLEFKHDLWDSARLQAIASIHTEADYAYLSKLSAYDSVTIDNEAWQVRTGETFLALTWSALEISYGYQIVNLGQGEMLSVLDVVNPRDLREPMPTETSVTHLPALMTRVGLAWDNFQLEAVVVHEPYFGLTPTPLGEFSPFRRLLLDDPSFGASLGTRTLRNQNVPARDFTNIGAIQPYGRIGWNSGAVDLKLLAGSPLDALGVPSLPAPSAFSAQAVVDMPIVHSRYALFGHSGSFTAGPFLLRWELGFSQRHPLAVRPADSSLLRLSGVRRNQLQGLLGLTYLPSTLTSAALDATQVYLLDNPNRDPASLQRTLFPVEAPQIALRFNQRFLGERASFGLVLLVIGLAPLNAWTARVELAYMLSDRFELAAGYVTYQPTRNFGFLYGLDHHDRAFLNLRAELMD